jgi:hypothetical protein
LDFLCGGIIYERPTLALACLATASFEKSEFPVRAHERLGGTERKKTSLSSKLSRHEPSFAVMPCKCSQETSRKEQADTMKTLRQLWLHNFHRVAIGFRSVLECFCLAAATVSRHHKCRPAKKLRNVNLIDLLPVSKFDNPSYRHTHKIKVCFPFNQLDHCCPLSSAPQETPLFHCWLRTADISLIYLPAQPFQTWCLRLKKPSITS